MPSRSFPIIASSLDCTIAASSCSRTAARRAMPPTRDIRMPLATNSTSATMSPVSRTVMDPVGARYRNTEMNADRNVASTPGPRPPRIAAIMIAG
jgi:hypothetical protein